MTSYGGHFGETCSDIILMMNKFFRNLSFKRVNDKDGFALYAACISAGLEGGYKRYILLYVPLSQITNDTSSYGYVHSLNWKIIQTRTLYRAPYKIPPQAWKLDKKIGDMMLKNTERTDKFSSYKLEACTDLRKNQQYEIVLLHDEKKKTKFQYHNKMTLTSAIETFQMIFTVIDTPYQHVGAPYQPQPNLYEQPHQPHQLHYGGGHPHPPPNPVIDNGYSEQYGEGGIEYNSSSLVPYNRYPSQNGLLGTSGVFEYTSPDVFRPPVSGNSLYKTINLEITLDDDISQSVHTAKSNPRTLDTPHSKTQTNIRVQHPPPREEYKSEPWYRQNIHNSGTTDTFVDDGDSSFILL